MGKSTKFQRKYYFYAFPNGKKKRPKKSSKKKYIPYRGNRLDIIERFYIKNPLETPYMPSERFMLGIYQYINILNDMDFFYPNEKQCLRIIKKSYDAIAPIIPLSTDLLGKVSFHINQFQYVLTLNVWKRLIKRIKKNNGNSSRL